MNDVLLLDSRDSFTFNLAQAFGELGAVVETRLASSVDVDEVFALRPALVCIGPGPRGPAQMPELTSLVAQLDGQIPLFGVCLGMQAIALARGGKVGRAVLPVHGKRSQIAHDGNGLFAQMPSPFWAMRYHSLVAIEVPPSLNVIATCADQQPMAFMAKDALTYAVQFHPESIGTAGGLWVLRNALQLANVSTSLPRQRPGAIPPPDDLGPFFQPGSLDLPTPSLSSSLTRNS